MTILPHLDMASARNSNSVWGPHALGETTRLVAPGEYPYPIHQGDPLVKAIESARAVGHPYKLNPTLLSLGTYQGIKDPPGVVSDTFRLLRRIPGRNPVVAAAIRKRQTQMSRYTNPVDDEKQSGWHVRMRDTRKKPTPAAQKRIDEITEILLYGGYRTAHPRTGQVAVWNAEGSKRAMGIRRAIAALIWDSLTLDAAAFEKQEGINAKRNPIAYWNPVDAATIRYATPKDEGKMATGGFGAPWLRYQPQIRPGEDIAYVRLLERGGDVAQEYEWNQMAYLVRNPRTDEWVNGYGYSELEMLIDIITGVLYGIRFNVSYFDNNHMPPGILSLVGQYGQPQLDDFRRELRQMAGGFDQWWRVPIVTAPPSQGNAANFVPLRSNDNAGMMFKEWMLFCGTIICALYGMDSTEINLANFGTSQNALANPNPEAKIEYAQESGLEPVLVTFGQWLDAEIVAQVDQDFEFEWCGLNAPDVEAAIEQRSDRMMNGLSTPNMEMAREDQPPIYDPLDREQWDEIEQKVRKQLGDEANDTDVKKETATEYKKAGGKLALWPDAPIGNALAMQVWQTEHQEDLGGGMQTDEDGNPVDPQTGQPLGPDGKPLPAPPSRYAKEGEDTHITDVGAAMLRAPEQPPRPPNNGGSQGVRKPTTPQQIPGGGQKAIAPKRPGFLKKMLSPFVETAPEPEERVHVVRIRRT